MGSVTKGRLIKITAAHPIGHIALPRASGTVSSTLDPTISLGAWLYQNLHFYDSYLVFLASEFKFPVTTEHVCMSSTSVFFSTDEEAS